MRSDLTGLGTSPFQHYLVGARSPGAASVHMLPDFWWSPTPTTVFVAGAWSLVTATFPGGNISTGLTTGTVTLYQGSTVASSYSLSTASVTLPSGDTLAIRLGNIPGYNVAGFDGRCVAKS